MIKVSIVIITYNEEENIENCLKSIVDISDDIIIVDSGSNDKTIDICKKYTQNIFYNKFENYSSQKNYANSLAKYNYVFSIDADEIVSEELKKSIFKINVDEKSTEIAYSFNRLNYHSGKPVKYCGWYPDTKIRIWNKNIGVWKGSVHEKIEFSKQQIIIKLKGDLLHYTYKNNKEHKLQADKFALLNAKIEHEKNVKSNYIKIIVYPFLKFINIYIVKLGILDGKIGFTIAYYSAYSNYKKNKYLLGITAR